MTTRAKLRTVVIVAAALGLGLVLFGMWPDPKVGGRHEPVFEAAQSKSAPARRDDADAARDAWRERLERARQRRKISRVDVAVRSHVSAQNNRPAKLPNAGDTCREDDCASRLAAEIQAMVEGCRHLMVDPSPSLSIDARILGSVDEGVIVESVEMSDASGDVEAAECLKESMYAIDLGHTDEEFDQSVKLVLGGQPIVVAGSAVPLEERLAVEAVLAKAAADAERSGADEEHGSVPIILFGE